MNFRVTHIRRPQKELGANALALLLGYVLICGCSSVNVMVQSEPSGATVLLRDKVIGVTPLDLKANDYKDEFAKQFLELKVQLKGHQPKDILVATQGYQNISLKLEVYDPNYYQKTILSDFQDQSNFLVREILQIQGLIVAGKNQDAEDRLKLFLQKYPNLSAPYVLQANLELGRKQRDNAIHNLERAISLDPSDAVVVRMLENLKKQASQ
jgi:tetratricopeptide (TPR) repeat protein